MTDIDGAFIKQMKYKLIAFDILPFQSFRFLRMLDCVWAETADTSTAHVVNFNRFSRKEMKFSSNNDIHKFPRNSFTWKFCVLVMADAKDSLCEAFERRLERIEGFKILNNHSSRTDFKLALKIPEFFFQFCA